jgi:hypothetical protein
MSFVSFFLFSTKTRNRRALVLHSYDVKQLCCQLHEGRFAHSVIQLRPQRQHACALVRATTVGVLAGLRGSLWPWPRNDSLSFRSLKDSLKRLLCSRSMTVNCERVPVFVRAMCFDAADPEVCYLCVLQCAPSLTVSDRGDGARCAFFWSGESAFSIIDRKL